LKLSSTYAEYVENLGNLTAPVVEHVIDTQAKFGVTVAFPGSTVEQAPAAATPVQAQRYEAATTPASPLPMAQVNQSGPPPVKPTPAYGGGPPKVANQSTGGDWKAQKAEEAFRLFMSDTTAWDDVRDKKTSDNSPDYRHKFAKDPPNKDGKEYKKSLWLKDAPEWAKPQLQQWGLL
jgi:hypothetical protein